MKIALDEHDSQPINILEFYLESFDLHCLKSIYSKHKYSKDASIYITFEDSMEIDMLIDMLKNYKDDIKQTTGM